MSVEVADVHLDEYETGGAGARLVYTDQTLRYTDPDAPEADETVIPVADVTRVDTETDLSLTGFWGLALVYLLVAGVATYRALLFIAEGTALTVVSGGTYVIAIFCWYGVVTFATQEVGSLAVLTVETSETEYTFLTDGDADEFEEMAARLEDHRAQQSGCDNNQP